MIQEELLHEQLLGLVKRLSIFLGTMMNVEA
jgi:hypothetical protein